jgi:hypothetical protein
MSAAKNRWIIGASALFAGLAGMAASAAPPLPGAIFTTNYDGSIVNGNTKYESKCGLTGVWLDGGPGPNAPQDAAGLPDGDYYFQVTDPSGKKLLSTDAVNNRCVTVSGGIITGNSCSVSPHNTNPSVDAGGGIVVELCPYDDTPNNGGVYKAWMTPVGDFVGNPALVDNACGNGCFHGFVPAASKTDNFKVRDVRTFCISVRKLVRDAKLGDLPRAGWPIDITDPSTNVVNTYYTDENGVATVCNLVPGFYPVAEQLPAGWVVVATSVNGTPVAPTSSVTIQLKNGLKDDTGTAEFTNEEGKK